MGIFTVTAEGLQGAMIQMLSHGVVSAALFLCVGVVYDRLHTREIARYGGLVHNMPKYAFCFMVFTLASVGLPGTSGFVGEFLALLGAFEAGQTSRASPWVAFLATTGMILGAAYMLYLYRRVIFEKITREDVRRMVDLHWREVVVFAPMIAVVLWMGIYPNSFLKPMQPSLARVIERVPAAASLAKAAPHLAQR
jgi:NADH-quinone oxidoreductase subunit M